MPLEGGVLSKVVFEFVGFVWSTGRWLSKGTGFRAANTEGEIDDASESPLFCKYEHIGGYPKRHATLQMSPLGSITRALTRLRLSKRD